MQKVEALNNLFVLEGLKRLEEEDNRPSAQTTKQPNPLHGPVYSKLAMGKFFDPSRRVATAHQLPGPGLLPRPDTEKNYAIDSIRLAH
jgi:hypothetical protein